MEKGNTVWLDIASVKLMGQNPKEHDIGAIIASMQRWGYIDVIGWNRRTGNVLDGNGRLEALRKMKLAGMAPPARVVADGDVWKAEFLQVDIDEKEEPLLATALNRTNELGGWDYDELSKLLQNALAEGQKLDGVGWSPEDVDSMTAFMPGDTHGLANVEGIAEPQEGLRLIIRCETVEELNHLKRSFGLEENTERVRVRYADITGFLPAAE